MIITGLCDARIRIKCWIKICVAFPGARSDNVGPDQPDRQKCNKNFGEQLETIYALTPCQLAALFC